MPAHREKRTLDEWRAYNYAVNYDLRQQFKALKPDEQIRYHALAYALPEWQLNRYGAPALNDDIENTLVAVANQNRLPVAWFLITFYTSEDGWDDYVRKFNDLPMDESFPREKILKKDALFSPQMPVDK